MKLFAVRVLMNTYRTNKSGYLELEDFGIFTTEGNANTQYVSVLTEINTKYVPSNAYSDCSEFSVVLFELEPAQSRIRELYDSLDDDDFIWTPIKSETVMNPNFHKET